MAIERKIFDEKERRMKLEAQLRDHNLRFEKQEQLVPVPTSGMTQPTFAKPLQPPKLAARTVTSVSRMQTPQHMVNTKNVAATVGSYQQAFTDTPVDSYP